MIDSVKPKSQLAGISPEEVNEINIKKIEVDLDKVRKSHADLIEARKANEAHKKFTPDFNVGELAAQIASENDQYFANVKKSPPFILVAFKEIVPLVPKSITLICAYTGNGKTTIAANIALAMIKDKKRVLCLSTEEVRMDVYNRLICLDKGWSYSNHASISAEQIQTFNEETPKLMNQYDVIDNRSFNGLAKPTTSLEGVKCILESLKNKNEKYDAIVIDYYQNISTSVEQKNLKEHEVQYRLVEFLDKFKNEYPAPIIIFAQSRPNYKNEMAPIKDRISGRKTICDVSATILEVMADHEKYETAWKIHKSRFAAVTGKTVKTGWDKGKYVVIDDAFKVKQAQLIAENKKD